MADNGGGGGGGDQRPLPPGWSRGFSRSQKKPYYVCEATKHTQWNFPTAAEVADPHSAKRRVEEQQRAEMERRKAQRGGGGAAASASASASAPAPAPAAASKRRSDEAEVASPQKRAKTSSSGSASADATSVAIIVPYRDIHPAQNRARHLREFVPHMRRFLDQLKRRGMVSDYHIYVIDQSDDGRKFNRGKLLNIGFDLARRNRKLGHDVFIFHDVDLLPGDDLGPWYARFPRSPLHIARVWDRYSNNPKYFGGIVSFSAADMRRINGYPNTFWGWGGEDDEMQKRCENAGIKWDYPPRGTIRDLEQMDLKQKLDFLRANKKWKCMVKWEALDEHETTWRTNGLADLRYEVLGRVPLDVSRGGDAESSKATKVTVDVKLNGNHWANDKCGVDYMGG